MELCQRIEKKNEENVIKTSECNVKEAANYC